MTHAIDLTCAPRRQDPSSSSASDEPSQPRISDESSDLKKDPYALIDGRIDAQQKYFSSKILILILAL